MSSPVEGFIPVNGSAGNSAPVGGRRHSRKLRMVKKSTVRRMLKSKGLKMRGGGEPGADAPAAMGGRRRRKSSKKSRGRRRSLFGMKY